jgi:hypothetical protein
MPCIFGFGTHDFCPCDLLTTDDSQLVDVVCSQCKRRLRCQYNAFLNDKEASIDWDDDFDDFVAFQADDRLHEICANYPKSCAYGLTKKESKIVSNKFGKVCDQYMTYG